MYKSYNLLGILFYKKGNYKKALDFHQKALALRKEIQDERGIGLSNTNLGNVYSELQLFIRAEQSYLDALSAFRKIGDEVQTANCLINLGVLAHQSKHYAAAAHHYELAKTIAEKINNYEIRCICLNNIAEIYYDKGDYQRSIAFNQDALKLRDLMENVVETADSYLNLALNYIRTGEKEKAKTCLDTAYTISLSYEYTEGIRAAQRCYSDYFSSLGNFKLAYEWLASYQAGADSIILMQSHANELFDENEVAPGTEAKRIRNLWLLVGLFISTLLFSLMLMKFKR